MSSVADGNVYDDVFVFEDLVYAMEWIRGVMRVYRYRNNSLIKLHDIRYPCECSKKFSHSIIVTSEHIVQCCASEKLLSILDHSGELLRKIPIAYIDGKGLYFCQVDVEGNFLIASHTTKRLVIANVNQPSSQWGAVDLVDWPGSGGCVGAVWFRHRLYVTSGLPLLTFAPVD